MLKIDNHAHILPPTWPNLAEKYGDDRFPVMTEYGGHHRIRCSRREASPFVELYAAPAVSAQAS